MFANYVFEKSDAKYKDKILLIDDDQLYSKVNYISAFSAHGFEIVKYTDDLTFRIEYEEMLKLTCKKLLLIASSEQYIPYDVRSTLYTYILSLENLFPKLHTETIRNFDNIKLDLLCSVYSSNYDELQQKVDTENYLCTTVFDKDNVKAYLQKFANELINRSKNISKYSDWFDIATAKANLDVMSIQYGININTQEINFEFQQYVLSNYGKLSQNVDKNSPVLLSKAMDYMYEHSDKFIIIVMDGMSEFDWNIISNSFTELKYEKTSMFAMIPSTTSVSRQCLLSGKYPSQLQELWKQSKEKSEYVDCAKRLGYTDKQIGYERGYDAHFSHLVRCGAVIINDVDVIVHTQMQGRLGMFNDISILANQKKLLNMTKRFLGDGYDVYITADHGNTKCVGLGKLMRTGVEVETKSRRMIVLKDFADKVGMIEKFKLIDYPKYYLPKEYDYLICNAGDSFDANGEEVITHGGITLDEVVVPFIKIKAVQ